EEEPAGELLGIDMEIFAVRRSLVQDGEALQLRHHRFVELEPRREVVVIVVRDRNEVDAVIAQLRDWRKDMGAGKSEMMHTCPRGGGYEVDQAAVGCPDRWNPQLMRPYPAVKTRAMQRGCTVERTRAVIGSQAHSANRRPMIGVVLPRERIGLGVEHKVNLTLA